MFGLDTSHSARVQDEYSSLILHKLDIDALDITEVKDMMTVAQKVGENLKIARKAKGLTQQKVAEAMNKYQSDYSDYERGLIQLDYDKIVFLCKMFEITPNELFSFE